MPCRSDYLEPRDAEIESRRVAQFIIYVDAKLSNHPATWILAAASSTYGNEDKVSELTAMLCATLRELTEDQLDEIVYNGRNRESRLLADWWDEHKEADVRHEQEDELILEAQPEFRSLTADGRGVIIELDWYKRAKKFLVDFGLEEE